MRNLFLIFSVIIFTLSSCDVVEETLKNSSKKEDKKEDKKSENLTPETEELSILQAGLKLPVCEEKNSGKTYYIIEKEQFQFCDGQEWVGLELGQQDSPSVLVSTAEKGESELCPGGGSLLQIGFDKNNNSILDLEEISTSSQVCKATKPEPPKNAVLEKITITAGDFSAPSGVYGKLFAVGEWSNGFKMDITQSVLVNWSSDNEDIVWVSDHPTNQGSISFGEEGVTKINAEVDGVIGSVTVTTTPAIITRLTVQYPYEPLILGFDNVKQVSATGYLTDGTYQDITDSSFFTVSDPTKASINNLAPNNGELTGLAYGCVDVTATSPLVQDLPQFPEHFLSPYKESSVNGDFGSITIREMKVYFESAILSYDGGDYYSGSYVNIDASQESGFTIAIEARQEDGSLIDGTADTEFNFGSHVTEGPSHGEFDVIANGEDMVSFSYIPDRAGQDVSCSNWANDGDPSSSNQPFFLDISGI